MAVAKKQQDGFRSRRKPAITRRVIVDSSADEDLASLDEGTTSPNPSSSVRKPAVTQRIVSSDGDSSDSIPNTFINKPSSSRTPIGKSHKDKPSVNPSGGATPKNIIKLVSDDSRALNRNNSSRSGQKESPNRIECSLNGVSRRELGFKGSERAVQALTGLKDGFVFRLDDQQGTSKELTDTGKENKELLQNGAMSDHSSMIEDVPEGTVIIQPESAPENEDDWLKSKEFKKMFTKERRERREMREAEAQAQNTSPVKQVFCTACTDQVNPFDKKTIFSHPVLSVVICRRCMEFYNSGPWKLDAEGIEENCRWCAEGGNLTCCDHCPRTFCKPCITRNLGRKEWSRIQSQKEWLCYLCDPTPLKSLQAKCASILSRFKKNGQTKVDKLKDRLSSSISKKKNGVDSVKKDLTSDIKEKETKKEKSLAKQDMAIAEEFLQYLVGNVSNRAIYMRSLVRLKKEVPDMQRLQMNLALKHIAEVKEVLTNFEATIKRHLHGDPNNKSDSALDGTDMDDFDSPERKGRTSPSSPDKKESAFPSVKDNAVNVKKDSEEKNGKAVVSVKKDDPKLNSEEEKADTIASMKNEREVDMTPNTKSVTQPSDKGEIDTAEESIRVNASEENVDSESVKETGSEKGANIEEDTTLVEQTDLQEDVSNHICGDIPDDDLPVHDDTPGDNDVESMDIDSEEQEETEKVEQCKDSKSAAESSPAPSRPSRASSRASSKKDQGAKKVASHKSVETKTIEQTDDTLDNSKDIIKESNSNDESDIVEKNDVGDSVPGTSSRNVKVALRSSQETVREKQQKGQKNAQKEADENDEKEDKDEKKVDDEEDDAEARLMSMIDNSDSDSDESDGSEYNQRSSKTKSKSPLGKGKLPKGKKTPEKKDSKKLKPEADSNLASDYEEPSKCGPGEDSSNAEGESGFDGIPGDDSMEGSQDETVLKKKGKTKKESSSSSELDDIFNSDDSLPKTRQKKRKSLKARSAKGKKRSSQESSGEDSDDDKDLKRLENLTELTRKRKRKDSADDDEDSNDDRDEQEKGKDQESNKTQRKPKKQKQEKSPVKNEIKSKEFISSGSSSSDISDDDDDEEDDEASGLKWKSLNKAKKKQVEDDNGDIAERLLMGEIENDEDGDDEDGDDEDDDEEMDGAGSKRGKRKARKRAAEEDEEMEEGDMNNGESRQNGHGGDADDGDDDKDDRNDKGDDKDKDYQEDEEEEEEEDEIVEESDKEIGTNKKKSHPLLRVNISGSEEDESEDDKKKKKKGKGKKGKTEKQAKGKGAKKKKKLTYDTDDFTSSESDEVPSESKKKRRVTRSQTASSTEESAADSKKKKKAKGKRKQAQDTSSEADSSKETKPAKKEKGGKRKRRRIKEVKESDSEDQSQTQDKDKDKDNEVNEVKENGSAGSGDEDGSPKKGRKKIRHIMKKSKFQAETLAAEAEEQERRKRVEEKRKQIIGEEDEKAEKSAVVKSCILEKDKETNEVVIEVDERIVKSLKPHQVDGIQFIFDSTFESVSKAKEKGGGCILAHCMGLGKTLQVISYLHTIMTNKDMGVKTCLVVAPLNTVLNWEDEFEKWIGDLDSGIEVYEMSQVKNNIARADYLNKWMKGGGVMIMGYAMYRNLSLLTHIRKKKLKEIFLKTLVDPGPDIVVCDEGHMLKNEASAISKAMNKIKTLRRVCLTGTPLQNNLIEYHCMVHFVKPNLLGTMREFKNRFVNPITNGQHSDSTARDVKIMKRRAHILHNLLSGSVQRKDYSALTKFLPPKHEYVVSVRLSEKQIALYEVYLNQAMQRNDDGSRMQPTSLFADYQVLMNVWNHPRLLHLAAAREDRNALRNMDDFITSEEEEADDNDSLKEFVISSDSDLEDPWATSKNSKKEEGKSVKSEPGPSRSGGSSSGSGAGGRSSRQKPKRQGLLRGLSSSSNSGSSDEENGGGNSDSSVEIVKTWNTRSRRTKDDDLAEGASTSAADFYRPSDPPKTRKEWYSDHLSEDDAHKIELSGKLVLLFEILKMAESVGEKVLVFSQSLLSLDLIENMLNHLEEKAQEERANGEQNLDEQIGGVGQWTKGEDYFRMDGSTPAHLRRRWSDIFNEKDNLRARLFIISTKAGSLGINLIAANRVIIFDANWNPSHDIQSIFRVYRFGQERAVFIYRFIAQGTMEEKIYDRQVTKQSLSQRVVDEHQIERHFTSADLSELYNFTPDKLDDPNRPERPTPVLPKDFFLAELLKNQKDWIVKYHEHDSLLENLQEEELTEEERKEAWKDYDDEKNGLNRFATMRSYDPSDMERLYQEGASILRMGEMMLNQPRQQVPLMAQQLAQMGAQSGGNQQQQMQRLLELQTYYRVQQQQQQRQRQLEQERQRIQQRYLMMQQSGQLPSQLRQGGSTLTNLLQQGRMPQNSEGQSSASITSRIQQLQQIAQLRQHQEMMRQQQAQKEQQEQRAGTSSKSSEQSDLLQFLNIPKDFQNPK